MTVTIISKSALRLDSNRIVDHSRLLDQAFFEICNCCDKICPSRASLRMHKSRIHLLINQCSKDKKNNDNNEDEDDVDETTTCSRVFLGVPETKRSKRRTLERLSRKIFRIFSTSYLFKSGLLNNHLIIQCCNIFRGFLCGRKKTLQF